MMKTRHSSLWRWICGRILALAIGSVMVIATCMWLRFAVQNYWIMHKMPPALREEFVALSRNPEANPARFHQIVDTWWGLSYSTPSIASADWVTVAVLVLVMIPFIVVMGLRYARPLSLQFSRLRDAAKDVTGGQFGRQAELIEDAPAEMIRFAADFNKMTGQLARYDKELRASHVAMAHELRSPLTAAIGRLQGMLDGVFDTQPQQLEMVMKQLQHLNRLTDELHLLSLADAGNLVLDERPFCLDELLQERAAWLTPQADAQSVTIAIQPSPSCPFRGDAFRMGQVFSVLMENAVRYGRRGDIWQLRCAAARALTLLILSMTGPAWRGIFYRICLNVLPARRRPAPDTPAAAASDYPLRALSAWRTGGASARRYRRAAACRFALFCRTLPPQKKTACLDNPLTQRRAILDECVM